MQLGPDPAAAEPKIVDGRFRQQTSRGQHEVLQRQAIVLVVIFAILVTDRGAKRDVAPDGLGEVHAKSGARRVRQWIHQRIDPCAPGGDELRILPTTRENLEPRGPEPCRHVVGKETGSVDDGLRANAFVSCDELDGTRYRRRIDQRRADQHRDIEISGQSGQHPDQAIGIDNAGVGRPQSGHSTDVRFAGAHERAIDQLDGDTVGAGRSGQRFEHWHFMFIRCHDEFAAARVPNVVGRAEVVQPIATLHAQSGLERAGGVVDAGVNHAAVPRAGAMARTHVAFEDADTRATAGERPCTRETHHSAADDCDVNHL